MRGRLLAASGDEVLRSRLSARFAAQGYQVVTVQETDQGLRQLSAEQPHLVIVDVSLPTPGWDGWELCRRIRQVSEVPLVALVPWNDTDSRIRALKLGADDVLNRGFYFEELAMRVAAILRRTAFTKAQENSSVSQEIPIRLDPTSRCAWVRGQQVYLTPREFDLLAFLVQNAGRPVSVAELLKVVWARGSWGTTEGRVKQYIFKLRHKLEADPANPQLILTRHSLGYEFNAAFAP